ncbi:MAG: EAL domain-containing protein [Lachnospiraceae bacterium]|nr:EAL domain-containing protein [Lachnospiraceae bacterium]
MKRIRSLCLSILLLMACLCYYYFNKGIGSLNDFSDIELNLIISTGVLFLVMMLIIIVLIVRGKKMRLDAKEQINFEQQRYKALVDYSHCNIFEYDFKSGLFSSETCPDFNGMSSRDFYAYISDTSHTYYKDLESAIQCYNDILLAKKDIYAEIRFKAANNEYQWFEITGTTIVDDEGTPLKTIAKSANIDKRKKELEKLKFANECDPLTYLYTFSTMQNKINEYILSDNTKDSMSSVLIIDIDDFDNVWESFGHSFGDAVLIDFANKLKKRVGNSGLAGYVACNRFIVFLENIPSIEQADHTAQIIQHIFKEIYLGLTQNINLTCSIGTSIYPLDATQTEELIENADIALYMAKKNGKNCIKSYSAPFRSVINMSEYLTKSINHSTLKPLHKAHSTIDSDLIFNIVDILFDSKDLETAINMALALIGNYYSIDQLGMYELSDSTLHITYSWCNSESLDSLHMIQSFSQSEAEKFALYKSSQTGIYVSDDVSKLQLKPSAFLSFMEFNGLKCLFQCGICDKGDYSGYFFAHSFSQRNDWAGNIADSLTLLAKIMGGYLLKHRSSQTKDRMLQYDSLTGANNLRSFTNCVSELITINQKQRYVIIYMDIDKFKYVNETYGYATGDYILKELANIIAKTISDKETFCRVVDDKFIVLAQYDSLDILKQRMINFNKEIQTIRKDENDNYNLIVNAGIYLITNYENISLYIDRANIARKSIKNNIHSSSFAFYSEAMRDKILRRKELENSMESALENGEFKLYLQPKYNIFTKKVCGAEALVRWQKPDYVLIPPDEFIPLFEENLFITELDYYIFDKTCELIRYMLDNNIKPVPVSINFSRIHLNNRKIIDKLQSALSYYNLTPDYLEIEITESALAESDAYMLKILDEIRKLGFKLTMDDFGSGLSSLNSLRKMPFDILKLDKDFFHGEFITNRERVVISNIVRLAKELNMGIVAEGIETEEQTKFLEEINCPVIQGYLFSKPVPVPDYINEYAKAS